MEPAMSLHDLRFTHATMARAHAYGFGYNGASHPFAYCYLRNPTSPSCTRTDLGGQLDTSFGGASTTFGDGRYVAAAIYPSGNSYLALIDMSYSSPQLMSKTSYSTAGRQVYDIQVRGNVVYMSANDAIVKTFDISDPANPIERHTETGSGTWEGSEFGVVGNHVYVGRYNGTSAYLYDMRFNDDGTYVTSSAATRSIGNMTKLHSVRASGDEVILVGDATGTPSYDVRIWDRSGMTEVGALDFRNGGYSSNIYGETLVLSYCPSCAPNYHPTSTTYLYDFADRTAPAFQSSISLGDTSGSLVVGPFLFLTVESIDIIRIK
jgi:hypothetical protein